MQMQLPLEEQWIDLAGDRPLIEFEDDAVADMIKHLVHRDTEDVLRLGSASAAHKAALCTTENHVYDALVLGFGDSKERLAERSFRIVLPFVEGVPPEHLIEQRTRDPDSLRLFRTHLLHLVQQDGDAGGSAAAALHRELGAINAEMSAIQVEARRTNWGRFVLVGAAELVLYISGFEIPGIATLGGIAHKTIREDAGRAAARRRMTSKPAFFLWNARRGRST